MTSAVRIGLSTWLLVCAAAQTPKAREIRMNPAQVADRVKHQDWDILGVPGLFGPEAAPALLPLLNDPNAQVRELAVKCLDQAGGPDAKRGLLKALHDNNELVRATASRLLVRHVTPADVAAIRPELAVGRDEYIREQLALLIGRIGNQGEIAYLAQRHAFEKDAHAKHAITLARARLGDQVSKGEYVKTLYDADPMKRAVALADLLYLEDRGLVPSVLPLLDDDRPAKNVGPSHGPYFIRVCDVAINTLDQMLGHPFPFATGFMTRYSPQQIGQAKAVLASVR